MSKLVPGGWYDYPRYYDLAMRAETKGEARFVARGAAKYLGREGPFRILEPACGTGRVLVALAKEGHQVVGYDALPTMIAYAAERFRRSKVTGTLTLGDMRQVVTRPRVDVAFNLVGSIRHLTHAELRRHLEVMAASVRVGGVYFVGLIAVPEDSTPEEGSERWTVRSGTARVTVRMSVVEMEMLTRREVVRTRMTVTEKGKRWSVQSEDAMTLYTPGDLLRILGTDPAWELLETYDFWYDLEHPEPASERYGDVVYVLRRRGRKKSGRE